MAENKMGKYLPYALGEILLVVVGILIALQINNWNEDRINKNLEIELLKSCLDGLEKDLSDAEFNVQHHTLGYEAMGDVINALESDEPIDEDSFAIKLNDAMVPTYFVHSTSAFETIKAKGVNIISDDDLRDQIIQVYDSRYTFFLRFEASYIEETDFIHRNVFPGLFEEMYNNSLSEPGFPGTIKPLNVESLRNNTELIYYLKTLRNKNNILINLHYKILMEEITGLMDNLKAKIEERKG